LGFDQFYPKNEVLLAIEPAVKQLAKSIGEEILRLNNRVAPKAVMLVGGGSLTPNLTTELGQVLDLPANRIAVRGIDAIQNLTKEEHIKASPELVTPIGIAIAAKKMPIQYMSLTVNNQVVRLFELKEMTVADAFLAANIRAKQLYGKPGLGLSVSVNGQDIFIPGGHGQPAEILVNGQQASTKTLIKSGDAIQLIEGQDGQTATATVRDLVDDAAIKTITIQQTKYVIEPKITVNQSPASLDTILNDRDRVVFDIADTIEDVFKVTNNWNLVKQFESYSIQVDSQPLYLPEFSSQLMINGKIAKMSYAVQDGDIISFHQPSLPTVQRIADQMNLLLEDKIIIHFQQEVLELKKTANEALVNQNVVSPLSTVPNGATIEFREKDRSRWIYQDVFRFSNWQLPGTFKGNFTILRNGQPASFDTEIFGGDQLEILLEASPIT
ncbi:MAG TPA: cell division protein, partial [Lysinibacillus sp.]|nr:cell division protein [Lysinibacillus sp.]